MNGKRSFLASHQPTPPPNTPTQTLQGGQAYTLSEDEQMGKLFGLGLLNGTYYTGDALAVAKHVRELMATWLTSNPARATQHAVYAAETLNMKLMPLIWLVYASTLPDKTLFAGAYPRIVGGNLKLTHDFMELCMKGGIRQGMGSGVKRVVNKTLLSRLTPYNVTRYTGKLQQVIRVTRPFTADPVLDGYLAYARRGTLTFARAQALATVTAQLNAGEVSDATLALIGEHQLQLEELKHTFGHLSPALRQTVFTRMVPTLNYNALVSNLVTIERAFATQTRDVVEVRNGNQRFTSKQVVSHAIPQELQLLVAERLRDQAAYRRSRMLFFGLLTAAGMTSVQPWRVALNETLGAAGQDAFGEVPDDVRVLVSADTSGSMSTTVTSTLQAVDVAAYLAAAVALSVPGSRAFATASHTLEVPVSPSESLIANATRIVKTNVGWGTEFESLLPHYRGEKYVVLITDGQQSDMLQRGWAKLDKPVGARLIIWHVVGTNYLNKVSNRDDVLYLTGYSDVLLRNLSNILQDKVGNREGVDAVVL